jgi:hypothetical protein
LRQNVGNMIWTEWWQLIKRVITGRRVRGTWPTKWGQKDVMPLLSSISAYTVTTAR